MVNAVHITVWITMQNILFLLIYSKLERAVNRLWTWTEANNILLPENQWIMESVMNSFYSSPGKSTPLMQDWICYRKETWWVCGIFEEAIFFYRQWTSFYSPLIEKKRWSYNYMLGKQDNSHAYTHEIVPSYFWGSLVPGHVLLCHLYCGTMNCLNQI